MNTTQQKVALGAAWLDDFAGPDWHTYIDLGELVMSDCMQCVLGQLVGADEEHVFLKSVGYGAGYYGLVHIKMGDGIPSIKPLTERDAVDLGFNLDTFDDNDGEDVDCYGDLQSAWEALILARRLDPLTPPTRPVNPTKITPLSSNS